MTEFILFRLLYLVNWHGLKFKKRRKNKKTIKRTAKFPSAVYMTEVYLLTYNPDIGTKTWRLCSESWWQSHL